MSAELYGPQSMVRGDAPPSRDPGAGADPPVPPSGGRVRFDDLILRLEVWRDRPAVTWGLAILAALVAGLGWWSARPPSAVPVEDLIPRADSPSSSAAMSVPTASPTPGPGPLGPESAVGTVTETPGSVPPGSGPGTQGPLVVHVIGEVARPGLVMVPPGSRIDDALVAAGGATASADVERLNLAAPLGDGSQIRVPALGEDVSEPLVIAAPGLGPGSPAGASPDGPGGPDPARPVDLNTAGQAELETLPGVGPATAAAIIAWRAENGGFLAVEDLTRVPGIGPAKLAALDDLVTV